MEKLKLALMRTMIKAAVAWKWRGKKATDFVATDQKIVVENGNITIRVYQPNSANPLPVILFFHGGGWAGFDINTHDALCRDLCVAANHIVMSVDYRLAPEYPFPFGINDCLTSLDWLADNISNLGGDINRIAVCGDSAGGNLAAIVAQQARKSHPGLIAAQILIYPVTDHPSQDWPSYNSKGGKGAELTHETVNQLWHWYTRDSALWSEGQTAHELATPFRVDDLNGLPSAFVLLAENDLLHDEGKAYAERMVSAGVEVSSKLYPNQQHGFVGTQPSSAHSEAVNDIANWLTAYWKRRDHAA
ncbi:alpha/beta hydrolase [Zhongshania sp. BJYM1]|uniref:alpha/beta hydrolase n=1 Tax=Zhongshania aquatica TaxID=2965069 RepID=UPI0022B419DA|nr:alpha/beta hydrolase [Marortus sp. BJYM1]